MGTWGASCTAPGPRQGSVFIASSPGCNQSKKHDLEAGGHGTAPSHSSPPACPRSGQARVPWCRGGSGSTIGAGRSRAAAAAPPRPCTNSPGKKIWDFAGNKTFFFSDPKALQGLSYQLCSKHAYGGKKKEKSSSTSLFSASASLGTTPRARQRGRTRGSPRQPQSPATSHSQRAQRGFSAAVTPFGANEEQVAVRDKTSALHQCPKAAATTSYCSSEVLPAGLDKKEQREKKNKPLGHISAWRAGYTILALGSPRFAVKQVEKSKRRQKAPGRAVCLALSRDAAQGCS